MKGTEMFCQDCERREKCKKICPKLEEHLKSMEGYQRELPFSPHVIGRLSETTAEFFQAESEDLGWVWDRVFNAASSLPPRLLAPFLLHYYQDMSLKKTARTLGLHPTTVTRRIRRAHEIIRTRLGIEKTGPGRQEDKAAKKAPRAELRDERPP